jgi:hypothetical protein
MKKSIKLIKDMTIQQAKEVNLFIDRKAVSVLKVDKRLNK